jgi:hypothetical protein
MMDTDATGKVALDHAWNWFNLHAGQRMQTFNFFLIATAFLIAAYRAGPGNLHRTISGVSA